MMFPFPAKFCVLIVIIIVAICNMTTFLCTKILFIQPSFLIDFFIFPDIVLFSLSSFVSIRLSGFLYNFFFIIICK
jgi:hypothetical protein